MYIIVLLVILLLLVIFIIYYHHYLGNNKLIRRDGLVYTNRLVIKKIYKMVYIVIQLMEKYNIKYWAEGGTLLGAVRHHGIIPWDEDADLQILESDEDKVLLMRPLLEQQGYELMKTWLGYKIFPKDGKDIKNFSWKHPGLDIFIVKITKNNNGEEILQYKYPQVQDVFGKCWSYYKDIFPLKKYKFGSFEINGPNNPYTYLNSCYGKDWFNIAYMQYDHENEVPYKQVKVDLTNIDRVPARPFYP